MEQRRRRRSPRSDDRFGLLLGVVVATVLLLLVVDLQEQGGIHTVARTAVIGLTAAMLLLAVKSAGVSRRWMRLAWTAAVVGVGAALVEVAAGGGTALSGLVPLAVMAAAPFLVLRRIIRHRRVTLATISGALSVYLLIAVAFAFAFSFVDEVTRAGMFDSPQSSTGVMYFSLVTITTLGYGDIQPVTTAGRALAVAEALVGQIYLVVVVARLVALFGQERPTGDASPRSGRRR